MANLFKLEQELLRDGRITKDEVSRIRAQIESDGKLDYDDVIFLVNLVANASDVCQEFDDLFFPAMRTILLEDGVIGMDEQYQLLRMLYSDGNVRPSERSSLKTCINPLTRLLRSSANCVILHSMHQPQTGIPADKNGSHTARTLRHLYSAYVGIWIDDLPEA